MVWDKFQVELVPKPPHRFFVTYFVATFVERIGPFAGISTKFPTKVPTKFPRTPVLGTSSRRAEGQVRNRPVPRLHGGICLP